MDRYYWVPIIIFFIVVIFNLVFIPYLFFAWSLLRIPAQYGVIHLLYISNIILLMIAGIIFWFGKRR